METGKPHEALLDVKDLRVYYRTRSGPVKAVDGVTFSVRAGEIFSVVGESGCGKSTLANAITRLTESPAYVAGGEILLKGVDILKLNEKSFRNIRWKEMSILPQSAMNALNPVMKTYSQIKDAVKAHARKVSNKEIRRRINTLAKRVMLPSYAVKAYPSQLSGGMKQRVVLVQCFILDPSLVIVDEPTSALDVVTQRKMLEFLGMRKDEAGTSIMLITHDIAVSAQVADRMMVMYAGKILEIGNIEDMFHDPLHPYTKALIEAVPSLGTRREVKGLSGLPPDLTKPPPGCRFHPRCTSICKDCDSEEPRLEEVKTGHLVACHLTG